MFINAIETIQQFTRPIHTIVRYYGNDFATPWTGTLFFVNDQGIAITCRHIAENIINSEAINQRYILIKKEKDYCPQVNCPHRCNFTNYGFEKKIWDKNKIAKRTKKLLY